jgi:opacity protein-like surface antigen
MRASAAILIALAAAPASAQPVEVSLLAGYTTRGDIENKAPGVQELAIGDGFAWGAAAGYFFSQHAGAELSWRRQESGLEIGDATSDARLFDVNVDVLQGSFVYRFGAPEARIRPFVAAGVGATFFGATDLESETKLSWSAGAGLKWFPARRWGARLEARYAPTVLADSSSTFCDPFGFCQTALHQFELLGGFVFRP